MTDLIDIYLILLETNTRHVTQPKGFKVFAEIRMDKEAVSFIHSTHRTKDTLRLPSETLWHRIETLIFTVLCMGKNSGFLVRQKYIA
jgi:hypothetical protein